MIEFFWYPNCSTCKKAKKKLDLLGVNYDTIDLKATPPSAEQFEKWFAQGNFSAKKFFNTSGLVYRELELKEKLPMMNEKEMAKLLSSNGMLIKRPLIVRNGEVILIGFKEEQYENELG